MTDDVTAPPIEAQPTWYIDDARPGIGDRPSWLNEKFKSAADLAKSYHELEKKVGTAPEEYDLSNSRFLDADYVPIQELLQVAKDKRVPKDVIDKMVDSLDKYMDEFSIDYSEEANKLGPNAKERLSTLDNWAKANLSEASYEALTSNIKSADAIKALEEIRGRMMSNTPMVPSGNDASSSNVATLDDVRTELSNNLEKYKTDPHYRKDLQSRLEMASKSSNFIDKVGY
jgi:hypothetical protein